MAISLDACLVEFAVMLKARPSQVAKPNLRCWRGREAFLGVYVPFRCASLVESL